MNPSTKVEWSPKKKATTITLQKEGYSFREIVAKLGKGASPPLTGRCLEAVRAL